MKTARKILLASGGLVPLALAVAGSTPTRHWLADAHRATQAGTAAQRDAVRRAWLQQAHPQWRTLSASGRLQRLAMLGKRMVRTAAAGTSDAAVQASAAFDGNLTLVQGPSGAAIALARQADCSLSLSTGTYTLSFTTPTIAVQSTTANYQDVLHAAGGLATQADAFPHGCASPTSGLGSRRGYYLGKTSQGLYMSAAAGYDAMTGTDVLYYGTVDVASQTVHSFHTDSTVSSIAGVTAGDLDGDGLLDVVVLDEASGAATVWLAHADGSLGTPVRYVTTGTRATGAVMADVDGDGKLDLVVSGTTHDAATNTDQQSIAVLPGNGDGTLGAARVVMLTTPSSTSGAPTTLDTLVAADLRGTGKPDLIGSNGVVLLNDGNGNFTQATTAAFPVPQGANTFAPFLATGDFNEDGKPDVVVNDGSVVRIYLGNGDGTFSAGRAYANDDSVGYVTVSDLDGDGHLDLWVGLANGGLFGGDQYGVRTGYALMGRGDGSFVGAPVLPFTFTGHNLADLNGDGVLDGVGIADDGSFVSAIGDGHGGFAAKPSLPSATFTIGVDSFTLGATPFSQGSVDSFDIADVNGDGKPDLVFVVDGLLARNSTADFYTPGILIALGDGHGGFAAPTFIPAPSLVASGDIDIDEVLSNLRLADVNGDGKTDLVYAYGDASAQNQTRTVGTAVQLGNGDGTFQAPRTIPYLTTHGDNLFTPSVRVQQIVDVNRDGKPDLVLAAQTTTLDANVGGYAIALQVALGNGDGTFAAPVTAPGPDVLASGFYQPVPVVVADMDGDGIPDLVTLGGSSGYDLQVAIAPGNGDGTFRTPSRTTFAGQYLGNDQQVAVGDFNGDGKPDVVVANPFGAAGIAFGAGDGTLAPLGPAGAATFNLAINLPIGGSARVADFNGDGRPDILVGDLLLASTTASASTGGAGNGTAGFALSADSTAGTLHAGQSAQAHLALAPDAGYNGTVTFSCSGLPAGAACAFAPASLALSGASASTTLTITTTAATVANAMHDGGLPAGLALVGLGALALRRRRGARVTRGRAGLAALVAACVAGLPGCSGSDSASPGTPPVMATPSGSATIVVTATDGSVSHTLNYTLVVD